MNTKPWDTVARTIAPLMKAAGARQLTVQLTKAGRVSYMLSPDAPKPGDEQEALWLDCTRWLINQCLGDSGTGASYWAQFPEFRTLCALAGVDIKAGEEERA